MIHMVVKCSFFLKNNICFALLICFHCLKFPLLKKKKRKKIKKSVKKLFRKNRQVLFRH